MPTDNIHWFSNKPKVLVYPIYEPRPTTSPQRDPPIVLQNRPGRMDQMIQHQPSQTTLFERLRSYPFSTDSEFANGLSIILGHPGSPANETEINQEDDLVLQAKCFYFSRKEGLSPPLDFAAYRAWLASNAVAGQSSENTSQTQQNSSTSEPSPPDSISLSSPAPIHAQEPTYPSSFAHIVELITTGQSVPGIQQIPDTVLTGHDTSSAKPRRLKPWEREETVN